MKASPVLIGILAAALERLGHSHRAFAGPLELDEVAAELAEYLIDQATDVLTAVESDGTRRLAMMFVLPPASGGRS